MGGDGALPQPARGAERVTVLLAGRVRAVEGARLETVRPACGGRACVQPDDVTELVLEPLPGSRRIVIDAAPLEGGRPLTALRRHWIAFRRASRGW